MKYLADTNIFLAVALDEPEKPWLVKITHGASLVAPSVLPYEVGNALSALVKRGRLHPDQVVAVWDVIREIPVELVEVDIRMALELAVRFDIYAYDAYYIQCALQSRCPLLTLDQGMRQVAKQLNVSLLEQL